MTPCAGCLWQVQHGQRLAANVRAARRRCGNCRLPLCREHARWEGRLGWHLCARCQARYDRQYEQRLDAAQQQYSA